MSPREALYAALMADGITGRGHTPDRSEKASALIEAFRHQVLTEAAELVTARSLARLEEIDEDDRRPSHWDRHQEWADASDVLLAARTAPIPPSA